MQQTACRVTYAATSEQQSVLIVEAANPGRLLWADEDERGVGPLQRSWRFLRTHPVATFELRLSVMPDARRDEVFQRYSSMFKQLVSDSKKKGRHHHQ